MPRTRICTILSHVDCLPLIKMRSGQKPLAAPEPPKCIAPILVKFQLYLLSVQELTQRFMPTNSSFQTGSMTSKFLTKPAGLR